MAKGFYYGFILILWGALFFSVRAKPLKQRHLLLWITYGFYSLAFEVVFGVILHLYYYISPDDSVLYILLASLFLYPAAIVLYSLYLPPKKVLLYTIGWIVLLQAVELITIYTKTLVLTGWKIVPWSPLTYLFSYLFAYLWDGYLKKTIKDEAILRGN